MYAKVIVIILLVTSPKNVFSRRKLTENIETWQCHHGKCGFGRFNCLCEGPGWRNAEPRCVPMRWVCDGWMDCDDGADEVDCVCPPGQIQCGNGRGGEAKDHHDLYNCINSTLKDDGGCDCFNCNDETMKTELVDPGERCDGKIERRDALDEINCTACPSDNPHRCACNRLGDAFSCRGFLGRTCYHDDDRCDGEIDCTDGSDEEGCTCGNATKVGYEVDDRFTCECYRSHTKSCSPPHRGCIAKNKVRDGIEHCEDGSDERNYLRTKCGPCNVTIRRLDVIEQCEQDSDCDNNTCVSVPALSCTDNTKCNATEIICTSNGGTLNASHSCNTIFQCENGYLEIAHNFCDGKVDCPDGSDEIMDGPGFKCSTSFGRCVLPQRNLHDDVAQCKHAQDLCSENRCFQCFDGKLNISQAQLCDGIIDCFDLSDECLCQAHFRKPICQEMFQLSDPSKLKCGKLNPNCSAFSSASIKTAQCNSYLGFNRASSRTSLSPMSSLISCQTKFGDTTAVTCDGRPECKDFSDECSCKDPPSFCNSSCRDYYQLGDRYCDGIVDEAWKFINNTSCPKGFDEKFCPKRFSCIAKDLISIDYAQVCDGNKNCDDGSDENACSIFSSASEMIKSLELRCLFWIMAVLVTSGNFLVFISTLRLMCKEKMNESQKLYHIFILNLSVSDFIMGLYLFIIAIKSVQYSGYYGSIDYQWRSSLECSIIGSLAFISSETSCFIMTIITAFRLYNVLNPTNACSKSTMKWKLGIVLAWSLSFALALPPVFNTNSNYFAHEVLFSSPFASSEEVWNRNDIIAFACRLASLSNLTVEQKGDSWTSVQKFLTKYFSDFSSTSEFGYYSETSVCMPRIYAKYCDPGWSYSLVIITFNFTSFLFVVISYVLIYFKVSHRPKTRRSDKRSAEMQTRIARLIATDFACWIPICVMVYISIGGVNIPNVVYIATAGVLLPINSALNPLLYSQVVEKYSKRVVLPKKVLVTQEINLQTLN